LLYEFNSFGERYGDGFDKNLAISAYQKALSIDPTFLPARHNLAIIYLRDGDLDKGIHALEQMLDNKKIEIDTCCVLAYAYEKKHDFLSAINYYKLALNGFTANIKKAAPELFKHINEKIKQLKRQ
jgi:tetratricopeptide (TPR) repeat protein